MSAVETSEVLILKPFFKMRLINVGQKFCGWLCEAKQRLICKYIPEIEEEEIVCLSSSYILVIQTHAFAWLVCGSRDHAASLREIVQPNYTLSLALLPRT
jgi:hypothetical protein